MRAILRFCKTRGNSTSPSCTSSGMSSAGPRLSVLANFASLSSNMDSPRARTVRQVIGLAKIGTEGFHCRAELRALAPCQADIHGRYAVLDVDGLDPFALQRPGAMHHVGQDRHTLPVRDQGTHRLDR